MAMQFFDKILESETFGEGDRHYFVDLCMAVNHKLFLRLTRSDRIIGDDGEVHYRRQTVRVFDEQLGMLIESMSNVFAGERMSLIVFIKYPRFNDKLPVAG